MPTRPLPVPLKTVVLGLAAGVVVYGALGVAVDWRMLEQTARALPQQLWYGVLALSLASYGLRFARWHGFIGALGHRVPVGRQLEIYLAAFALTLTPAKTGETIRSLYLHRHGVPYGQSIGAFVAERLLDLLAVGALSLLSLTLYPAHTAWLAGTVACVAAIAFTLRSRLLPRAIRWIGAGALAQHATQGTSTMGHLLSGARLAQALPLSLAAWIAQGLVLHAIVTGLGHDLPVAMSVAVYCASILAGAATMIPGGLGATEAALSVLLAATGLDPAQAVVAALLARTATLWVAIALGLAAMGRLMMVRGD